MRFAGDGRRIAGWLGLAAGLGLLGAALDQIHVQSGLLSYPDPAWWDQAWWVPLNFAVLLTSLVAATATLARARLGGEPVPDNHRLAIDFAWFAGAYALSGLVAADAPTLLAVAYFAAWLARVAPRPERRFLLGFGVALAFVGCAVEATEIALDWFSYADPDVAGVPLWLAGIYLHGSPLALDVARRVDAAGPSGGKRSAPA